MRTPLGLCLLSLAPLVAAACSEAAAPASPDRDAAPTSDTAGDLPDAPPPDASPPPDAGPPSPFSPGAPLPATASCAPAAAPCVTLSADPTLRASYRKDSYFTDDVYDEYTDYPVDGGRLHVAGIAAASGPIQDVRLGGVSVADLLAPPSPAIEWYHVWPDPAVAGEPLWVALHSRDPAWDAATEGTVQVETAAGLALDGTFPVAVTPLPLTWVTVTEDRSRLLVHVANRDDAPHTATGLLVGGRDVWAGGAACAPDKTVAPGAAALWEVPLCEPAEPGAAWTVAVTWADAPDSVGVGRVLRPHFPIEAWSVGGDCVAPGGDSDASFEAHLAAGFDTFYLYWGSSKSCTYQTPQVVNELLPASGEGFVLVGDDFLNKPDPEAAITDSRAVAGFLTGDESDGQVYLEDGSPKPETKAADARRLWSMYPELAVYNGAMTNGNVGTFAGMVDVQGIDVYLAGCAPHITVFGAPRPITAPHDYLRNARDNHMPWATWFYAQGLHGGWNVVDDGTEFHLQPDPQEVLIQAMMVMTSGGKGLMWFQTSQEEAAFAPERWEAIAQANWMFRGVRHLLREGDLTGQAVASAPPGDVLVEAIRARDAIVVPVVALKADVVVDDFACVAWVIDNLPVPHWILATQQTDVTVRVPGDLAVTDAFEVTLGGEVVDAPWETDPAAREVRLPGLDLSNEVPVRLLVLAADTSVRQRVAAELAPAGP